MWKFFRTGGALKRKWLSSQVRAIGYVCMHGDAQTSTACLDCNPGTLSPARRSDVVVARRRRTARLRGEDRGQAYSSCSLITVILRNPTSRDGRQAKTG